MRRKSLFLVILSLLIFANACDYRPAGETRTVTGLVDATEIDVASKIPGRIMEISVKEGDVVKEGDQLLKIESDEILAKIEQANAGIAAADAQLRMARKGAREEEKNAVRKELEAAQHQVSIMQKTYDRMLKLKDTGAIPQQKFDEIEFKYNVAKDQLAMAEAKYAIYMKGARVEEIEALEALVERGRQTLAEIESYKKETIQYAPISGEVSKLILHKGELTATGYPIVTLVDMSDLWSVFAVREDMLSKLKKDQEIEVFIPALNRSAKMKIFNIAALGDFATWRATNDRNSFDLKSFEIKARPVEVIEGLRPGMTVRWTE